MHCTGSPTSAVHWFSKGVSGFTGYVISALLVNWLLNTGIAGSEIIGVVSQKKGVFRTSKIMLRRIIVITILLPVIYIHYIYLIVALIVDFIVVCTN